MRTKKWHVNPPPGGGGHTPPPLVDLVVTFNFDHGEGAYQVSHRDPLVVLPGQKIIFLYPTATVESVFIPLAGIFEPGAIGSDQIFPFVDLMHIHWPNIFGPRGPVTLPPNPSRGTIITALGQLPLPRGSVRPPMVWHSIQDVQGVVLTVRATPSVPQGTRWAYAVHDNPLANFAIGNSPPNMHLGP